MPNAQELILSEISAEGAISFARFLEIALYHPEVGYYSTGRATIGRGGDFYTSVSVGSIFSRVLFTQFEEIWGAFGKPEHFSLVEFGAHTGLFAADLLRHAAALATPFSNALEYHIVENHPRLQKIQAETLHKLPHRIHTHWEELTPFQGIVFANELLDAFPFHLIEWTGSYWLEHRVRANHGLLQFTRTEITDPLLEACTHSIPLPLPPGYLTEVSPLRQIWLEQICQQVRRGVLFFIDYGYPRAEFFAPYRRSGTFACYHRHRRTSNPLDLVGEQDITAHVEFTSVIETAEALGFSLSGLTDQHHFLTAAAEPWLRSVEALPLTCSLQSDLRQLQTLLHPAFMGRQFQVLALSLGLPLPTLSGFRQILPRNLPEGRSSPVTKAAKRIRT